MATKQIKWTSKTTAEIEILDGPAIGKYMIDIESYQNSPCAGYITFGQIKIDNRFTDLKIETTHIPEYSERYAASPKGLRAQRDSLANQISGILDEQQYRRERWFEAENKRGPMPQYATAELDAAKSRLAEFDAAHPEIIAAIKTEKAASVEAHMWD